MWVTKHRISGALTQGTSFSREKSNLCGTKETSSSPGNLSYPQTSAMDQKFPATCSISSVQQLCDIATKNEWIRAAFPTSAAPFNPSFEYVGIWGRPPVNETALMNDAMLNCLARWSPDHYIECVQLYGIGYDSLNVVTGMLYLSSTWPGT